MKKPTPTTGLRHLALKVSKLDECVDFYTQLMGIVVEGQPDADNIYLSSGHDNLALLKTDDDFNGHNQRLDHLGFILDTPEQVDEWHAYFIENNVAIISLPKTHRDGARSFYCKDPDGNTVQLIFHPPLSSMVTGVVHE